MTDYRHDESVNEDHGPLCPECREPNDRPCACDAELDAETAWAWAWRYVAAAVRMTEAVRLSGPCSPDMAVFVGEWTLAYDPMSEHPRGVLCVADGRYAGQPF